VIPPGLHVVDGHDRADGHLPVVLVHGSPDRSRNFRAVVELLPDLPLILSDRRGYGQSLTVTPPSRSFADHAADLLSVLDGRRAVVVAQSVGSNVAMTAAAMAPDLVASLGRWEPPTAWADWWPTDELLTKARSFAAVTDTRALGEAFNRDILGDDRWESLSDRTREMLRAEGAAFCADMAAETEAPFAFEDIRCPCVIGYGTATSTGHEEGARRLGAVLGCDLYEVAGANHFAPISNPPAFAELVRRAVALAAP
jgi:pimeloyl-ACP methyl ester carboxylesterase